MAHIEKTKVVTDFIIHLKPNEYQIMLNALEMYEEKQKQELNELRLDETNEFGTEHEEKYLHEVQTLKSELEKEFYGERVSG